MRTGCAISAVALALAGAAWTQPLPGTAPLKREGDLAMQMVEGIDHYLTKRLAESPARRDKAKPNREELRRLIGAVDPRVPFESPWLEARVDRDARVGAGRAFEAFAVRWPVLEGVDAEGLLLRPQGAPGAGVVAIPDADQTPEMLAGLAPGLAPQHQFARRLAENGCLVLVPALINREDTHSGMPGVRFSNQPHREFIYRMAYEMGRHIIGYEVQKVLAAVDWFTAGGAKQPVGVFGFGEGGLLALFAGALDERIRSVAVSGYFGPREGVWREPIYRNVWSQLEAFGDAELARMIAPRRLVVEAAAHPKVDGPPAEREGRRGAAPGAISTPPVAEVRRELARAGTGARLVEGGPGSEEALREFLAGLSVTLAPASTGVPAVTGAPPDAAARHKRQFDQLVEFTQRLVRRSDARRREFFAKADTSRLPRWEATSEWYRGHLWDEVIGRMPPPAGPLRAETRRLYDQPGFTGYEVLLPVWPEVFAYGILLVPKDVKPGERRPVVVCQHGLEDRPQFLIDPPNERKRQVYLRFAATLAERGFVTYAPQNPYIGEEKFRVLLRKAHPVKLSLFSFIIGQHERTLEWLTSLPFVDGERIGFYGLSYGGKTAMRMPALVKRYALSICSADFNEWIWKNTSVDQPFSYMYTREYDMLEFNLGHTFNYAEMAMLIAPRPFMVERGHRDGVGIDEWVALEYAKVRRFYADLKIPERTEIEFFDGPHAIHGVGTYEFLHRHLRWPRR